MSVEPNDRDREVARNVMWRGFEQTAAEAVAAYRAELEQKHSEEIERLKQAEAELVDLRKQLQPLSGELANAVSRWEGREPHQHTRAECDAVCMANALRGLLDPAVETPEQLLAEMRRVAGDWDEYVRQRSCVNEWADRLEKALRAQKP